MFIVCQVLLFLAAFPACLFCRNLFLYRSARVRASGLPGVSILIPARNEEASIEAALRSALATRNVDLEVIVVDDHSEDRTAAIVSGMAAVDGRLRLTSAPEVPQGWCGKQFACHTLAKVATKPVLCFVDADVRLQPDGLSRAVATLTESRAGLLSGFPRQETVTMLEQCLIPLMHFLLLGFLPLDGLRSGTNPAYAAGCGQFMLVHADAYARAGGHEAIRWSRHDGITLPRAFRLAGERTDLFNATDVATCRMYHNASEVVHGLLKNATEGLAAPRRIVPFTALLAGGQVLPLVLLPFFWHHLAIRIILLAAVTMAYLPRLIAVRRFRQPLLGAVLHPVSIVLLLALQWWAAAQALAGGGVTWKGRSYEARAS